MIPPPKTNKDFSIKIIFKFLPMVLCLMTHLAEAQVRIIYINKAKTYQKIDGFGAFGLNKLGYEGGPFYSPDFVKTFVEDLGATISRAEAMPIEESNDNSNPRIADRSKFNPSPLQNAYYDFAKEAQLLANSYGDTIKFIYSIYTPPAWMKYVNANFSTSSEWNRLMVKDNIPPNWVSVEDMKEEFAEHCIIHTRMFREKAGFDLYGISLQNEPSFTQEYNSCVYSNEQYRNMLKVVGNRFREEKLSTKFIMNEEAISYGDYYGFLKTVTSDSISKKYFDIAAVHDYGIRGIQASDVFAGLWTELHKKTSSYTNAPLWQTESAGYSRIWEGNSMGKPAQGFSLAQDIYKSLKYGKVSAWLWWQMGFGNTQPRLDTSSFLLYNNIKTKNFYVLKQYARFIRPNAVNVDADCPEDNDILALAFQHDVKKTLTLVILNQSSESKTVRLSFPQPLDSELLNPSRYRVYQTNKLDNCIERESIDAVQEMMVAPLSITTLVGENSLPYLVANERNLGLNNALKIYPNPGNSKITLEYSENNHGFVEIKDAYSRIVKTIPLPRSDNHIMEIDISDLINGIYLVKIGNQSKQLAVAK